MEKGLKILVEGIIRLRWVFLSVFLVITLGMIYVTKDLQINNDYETWLPTNDRVGDLLRTVDREFSNGSLMFVVLDFTKEGVFTPESLALVERLTRELEGIDELFQVTSLTNIMDIKQTEDGIEVSDLIPSPFPTDRDELKQLEEYVLSKETFRDSLVSLDAGYTLVATSIESVYDEIEITGHLLDIVKSIVGERQYYVGGDVVVAYYMDYYMKQDLMVLVPIIIIGMVFVLAYGLRRITGVIFSFIVVIISIIWTVGMKALFGYPFNILSPAVVVLLMAVGSDYAVHMYNHYLKKGDIRLSTTEIALPIFMSAMTTVAGLATFSVTKIEVLKNFGLELAFGLGAACLLSIILLTILVHMVKGGIIPKDPDDEDRQHGLTRAMAAVGGWVHDHTRFILAFVLIFLVIMGMGITRINTSVDFVELLPTDSPPRSSSQILEEYFSGMYRVSIYFQGDVEDPGTMTMMHYIENYLRSNELVGSFMSINDLIAEENWLLNGVFAIPETRQGIANLWFMLEGQDILKTFVTTDRKQAMVNAILKKHDTGYMKKTSARIQQFLDLNVSPEIVRIDPALLSDEGHKALDEVQLYNAARQISWLAQSYDRAGTYDPAAFQERLEQILADTDSRVDMDPVWDEVQTYLDEETVEILPAELVVSLTAYMKNNWGIRDDDIFSEHLRQNILTSGIMDAEDSEITVAGMMKRAESTYRMQKVAALRQGYFEGLGDELAGNKDFLKRADGVLWRLFSNTPVVFAHEARAIPGSEKAILDSVQVEIDQTGAHEMFSRFDKLLYQSQTQSLILASIIVLIMISLTQKSFRRGVISLLSVLVPLEFTLGFMGWVGIPLDFGTVLCSALIIGLGVDGSIHFLHYYHKQHLEGLRGKGSLQATLGHVGRAVITANSTSFLGFIVLMFSKTTELRNFAIINALAIFLVTLSVLTLLPTLASLVRLEDKSWRIVIGVEEHQIFDNIFEEE